MESEEFWKKYFQVYDTLNKLIPYQNLLDRIVQELDPQAEDTILDAGCGTGNLALKIEKQGAHVVGLDSSREALKRFKQKSTKAEIIVGDLRKKLPFQDNFFDGVVSNNVIYTLPKGDHQGVVEEFYRVLKPGGKIVIVNPKKDWSAKTIYMEGIQRLYRKKGFLRAIGQVAKLIIPTVKILYYNAKIKKESRYYFFASGEQKALLKAVGFQQVSTEHDVYAGQSRLVSAVK